MHLEIPPDIEHWLKEHARNSGMSEQQFALKVLQEQAIEQALSPNGEHQKDHTAWMAELRNWSIDHPGGTHFVDDSRESIYEGRGL